MNLQISRSREQLSIQDIVRVENALGFSLPEQYRHFLLVHNGGRPKPNAFPIINNPSDSHGVVDFFLCIKEGDICNLLDWVLDFSGRVPPNLLPIATDPGGNLICLSVAGQDAGRVYFWDHEREVGDEEKPDYRNVYLIASSLAEFLSSLIEL